jgi:hypothetical protein
MMPRSLVDMWYHLGCTYCLHLQGRGTKSTTKMEARIITQKTEESSKCRYFSMKLHDVTC